MMLDQSLSEVKLQPARPNIAGGPFQTVPTFSSKILDQMLYQMFAPFQRAFRKSV